MITIRNTVSELKRISDCRRALTHQINEKMRQLQILEQEYAIISAEEDALQDQLEKEKSR